MGRRLFVDPFFSSLKPRYKTGHLFSVLQPRIKRRIKFLVRQGKLLSILFRRNIGATVRISRFKNPVLPWLREINPRIFPDFDRIICTREYKHENQWLNLVYYWCRPVQNWWLRCTTGMHQYRHQIHTRMCCYRLRLVEYYLCFSARDIWAPADALGKVSTVYLRFSKRLTQRSSSFLCSHL